MANDTGSAELGHAAQRPDPADVIAAALTNVPTAASLNSLSALDPFDLTAVDQLDLVIALDRHASWVASLRMKALAAVAGPAPDESEIGDPFRVDDPVREEVAAALRMSGGAASDAITVARDLHTKLPGTAAQLAAGSITYSHAVVLSSECERLSSADAAEVERLVLNRAASKTPGQVRRHARRVAARIAPMPLAEEVDAEFAKREVRMFSDGGVMATIEAVLPAPDAMAVWNALTACAHAQDRPEDARTLAHKRADALTSWANRALEDPSLPTHHGRRRLETQVLVDLPTLLGLADNPGELVGFGPIPANMARQLAADSCWRRLVTHPVTGHLLDYGAEVYEPPRAVRDYVLHRDRTCRFPGCSQPAYRTDLDHTVAFDGSESGGSTASANLHCLCRRHHRLKTHGAWTVSTADSETDELLWTSPRGKEYSSIPPPPLDRQPAPENPPGLHSTNTRADEQAGTPIEGLPRGRGAPRTDFEQRLARRASAA